MSFFEAKLDLVVNILERWSYLKEGGRGGFDKDDRMAMVHKYGDHAERSMGRGLLSRCSRSTVLFLSIVS